MPLTSGNFADLLKPGLRRVFDIGMSRPRPMMEMLFGQEVSTRYEEQYQGMGAQGLVPPFNGTVPYHDFDAGYRTDIRNYEFAMGMQVERRLVDDDQFNQIRRRASNMTDSFNTTIEADAANIFINGFTDSGTNRMEHPPMGAMEWACLVRLTRTALPTPTTPKQTRQRWPSTSEIWIRPDKPCGISLTIKTNC